MSKRPTHKELIVANNLLTENWLISIIYSIGLMKSFYKFIVHLITGKCELERLLEKYDGCQQILLIGMHLLENHTLNYKLLYEHFLKILLFLNNILFLIT